MVNAGFSNLVLDRHGNPAPLSMSALTASLMGSYDASLAVSFRVPPYNPNSLITSKGYEILDKQLHMACCLAPLNIIRYCTLRKNWDVESALKDPADPNAAEAQMRADHLKYDLTHIKNKAGLPQDFRHVIWELLYAVHVGFRVTEMIWKAHKTGPYAGKWGFAEFAAKPAKQMGFDSDLRTLSPVSLTSYSPLQGYQFEIPIEKVLYYRYAPQDNLPYGNGIGRTVYKNTWSIDFLLKFWNLGLEKFGSPNYKAHAPQNLMPLVASVLDKLRQGGAAVFPSGVEAELMQAAAGGLDGFLKAIEWHSRQCALAYENAVLTSGEGEHGATSAGSDVHQDTSDYGHFFVRSDIENVLNLQMVDRWHRYNYGEDETLQPRVTLGDWDEADIATLATAFKTLCDGGFGHPLEPQWRDRLNLQPLHPDFAAKMEQEKQDTKDFQQKQLEAKSKGQPPQ